MLLFLVFCAAVAGTSSDETGECVIPGRVASGADYYWRDYVGIIPDDAIEGGYTAAGNKTYVGHFRHESQPAILVGNIYAGKKQVPTAFDGKYTHETYVLILCSGKKDQYQWRQTDVDDLHLLSDYHLVKGGNYNSSVLHIGRVNVDDQVKVGHVYPMSHPWKGLWVYRDDGTQSNYHTFAVLVLPR